MSTAKPQATPSVVVRPEMPNHDEVVKHLKKDGKLIVNELTPDEADLWHMATGLSGELGELFLALQLNVKEDILEELGDSLFYFKGIWQNLKENYEEIIDIPELPSRYDLYSMVIECGEITDAIKKAIIYRKHLDVKNVIGHMGNYYSLLSGVMVGHQCPLTEVEAHNSNKLWLGRYPEGAYTDGAAQKRADKTDE